MIVPLIMASPKTCGGKAGALGTLLRAGLPVPDGFVIPFDACRGGPSDAHRATANGPNRDPTIDASLHEALIRGLDALGDPPVAVRSSAANEDTATASAAGQHESFLAVCGISEVAAAVRACWASLYSRRAVDYRGSSGPEEPSAEVMAVLVQRHVDAEISGVMFTPSGPDGATEIEASWGLGPSIVEGTVNPDAYHVTVDGSVGRTVADKRVRLDRRGTQLVRHDVPVGARTQPSIDDATAARLARLGQEVAAILGGGQDIEWAIADGTIWLLQARPVTAVPPPSTAAITSTITSAITSAGEADNRASTRTLAQAVTLAGTPGSHGTATGAARIVRGPGDFARVRPGDILVCPYTDPAWTPLLRVAAGVVTETGGVLSHAAIVARERHIPAVLGLSNATTMLQDGAVVAINGTTGTVTTAVPPTEPKGCAG